MSIFRSMDLRKVNSVTKYPSILTYHEMGERGRLGEAINVDFSGEKVYVSEKVDGTNARCIVPPASIHAPTRNKIVGSREEFLHYTGDLIYNPQMGIVEATLSQIEKLIPSYENFRIWFYEVFGGGVGHGWKNYAKSSTTVGIRIFDIMEITPDEMDRLLSLSLPEISSWREHGGQQFLDVQQMNDIVTSQGLDVVPAIEWEGNFPLDHNEMLVRLIMYIPVTMCSLEEGSRDRPEGIVVRTFDRKLIAKIRFEDYQRTLRGR